MNIKPLTSTRYNPYLLNFVERVLSGEIDPTTDQVFVYASGALAKLDLKRALPPELFEPLEVKSIQRESYGVRFQRTKPKVVFAILSIEMCSTIMQIVSRVSNNVRSDYQGVSVYMGASSAIGHVPGWPYLAEFSGPFSVPELAEAFFKDLKGLGGLVRLQALPPVNFKPNEGK